MNTADEPDAPPPGSGPRAGLDPLDREYVVGVGQILECCLNDYVAVAGRLGLDPRHASQRFWGILRQVLLNSQMDR